MFYLGMFLAASLSPLGSTMIAVALPSIGTELGVGGGRLTQWLVSSYLIVGIAAMSPGGRLGDRIGHRRGLILGMIIYGAGSVVGFTVATLPSLALARISMAAGGAMTIPATLALLRNTIPFEKRPRAFGYFGSAMGIAAAIGPLVGGELTAQFGWRSVFIANLPVIAVSYWLIRRTTRAAEAPERPATPKPPAFDVVGSILLGLGLTLLVIALQMSGSGMAGPALLGAVVLGVFVFWERRVAQPVLDLRLFLQPTFSAASLVIGLQNLAMYSLLFQLPIFFEQVRGVEPGTIGRTIIAMMLAMVVCSPLGGRFSERFGARAISLAGTITSLLGVYLISDFRTLQSPGDLVIGLVLMGAGLGLSSAPAQAAAMSAVPSTDAGMAGGAVSTARYIGAVIGISALGYLLAGGETAPDKHNAATAVYLGALVLAALSSLALPGKWRHSAGSSVSRNL
ncbi:MAG: MFS transporter [Gemmatimonadota bacterium]|nr:MFS transporter [Gemmatimonadota bacterium]